MKKGITLFLLYLFVLIPFHLPAQTISSPDGRLVFTFHAKPGLMTYHVNYDGKPVILESELGIDLDNRLLEAALGIPNDSCSYWGENLKLKSFDTTYHDSTWTPLYGENSSIRDHYSLLTLHFTKGKAENSKVGYSFDKRCFYQMDIEVRAYDEGIALRYHFPEQSNGLFLNITGERTSFRMPQGTQAFYEEWAQGPFAKKALKDWPGECERPLFMQLQNGLRVALLEARMAHYARGKFRLKTENELQVSLFSGVEQMSPYSTPWRVIMVGSKATDIINHKDLVWNLNEPCRIQNTDFIRPGKAYRCGRLERSYILDGIHFAKEQGLQFVELDARWYGPEMAMSSSALKESADRNFTVREICDSARHYGLGVWVYVNQRALYQQLDSILPLYKQWGVSGIKFGFVQVGNQMWTTWLHDAVRKCAEYDIMVDIHDEYRPTGLSRTYPNLLTQEGVGGNEEMPDATHDVTLPFTRFVCGPADYTLSYYCNRIKNTRGHQLAMAAVYYSPLQFMYWYDDPKVFDGGEELAFWKQIPTVFDESIALGGECGEYIIQARRSGNIWYIGAMTNQEARNIVIPTSFLKKGRYHVTIYNDDPTLPTRSKVKTTQLKIKAGQPLKLHLQKSGGAAMIVGFLK